ncbi:hypothetical protein [Winogradskya humida]|uniref:Uncharacterized protein n=1 Tax=Winogradskya humida TaxID=113566 RepID=A0ABQ4A048_9ACTN|nr:hypothetical protein [Actinoplanes humidus]GIE23722.1 hypothetical protein Ahu01nite_068240 [Actinoplanes humidus]
MMVPRHVIVTALRERGKNQRADWVDRSLPDQVDLHHQVGLLATLDLSADDLVAKAAAS